MKRTIFLMLTLILLGTASIKAQVAIGKDTIPHQGAILDLKSYDTGGTPINKGLKLPTVSLVSVGTYTLAADGSSAAGMIVFNTNESIAGGTGKGLYVWEGCFWEPVGESQVVVAAPLVIGINTYSTARFGAAGIWMTENLREVPSEGVLSGAYSYVAQHYNIPNGGSNTSDPDTIAKYGYLYNWKAAMGSTGATNVSTDANYTGEKGNKTDAQLNGESGLTYPVQGICPTGWHLPSDWEWTQLENVLGQEINRAHYTGDACGTPSTLLDGSETDYRPTDGSPTLDMKMRAPVKTWEDNYKVGVSKTNDQGGFDVLPAGNWYGGSLGYFGLYAYFWSSSSSTTTTVWRRPIDTTGTGVSRSAYNKRYLYSVRCKKDN